MPTSDHRHLSPTAREIVLINPTKVLDIGIGMGKWGVLAREYTDAWCHRRYYKKDWQTQIIGIEIYPEYKNPAWDVYNAIYIGDVVELLPEVCLDHGPFDLTIMMDVLEHIPREVGLGLIDNIVASSKNLILSFANTNQKDICANTHEDHISRWSIKDFQLKYDVRILDCTAHEVQALMLIKPKGQKA